MYSSSSNKKKTDMRRGLFKMESSTFKLKQANYTRDLGGLFVMVVKWMYMLLYISWKILSFTSNLVDQFLKAMIGNWQSILSCISHKHIIHGCNYKIDMFCELVWVLLCIAHKFLFFFLSCTQENARVKDSNLKNEYCARHK